MLNANTLPKCVNYAFSTPPQQQKNSADKAEFFV